MTTTHAAEVLRRFEAVDRFLQTKGFPATSPWWHGTIRHFYGSGRRQAVLRCGRRAGKSSTLCRLAVVEGLYGEHAIPPGDVGVVAFISTTRDEASQRLRTVKAILDALGVKYRPCDGGVELADRPVAFKVYTASVSGVSGFTGILIVCDEVAKWKDSDTGQNPATEVLASVRPTMATQRNARIVLSSSPMGKWDAHFDAFEQGDTDFQVTAYAPTWTANPTITEADTHQLEPDEATWAREYKAIPATEIAESLFMDTELDTATRAEPETVDAEEGVTYAAAIDPATRRNAWTLVVAALRDTGNGIRRSVVHACEWIGSSAEPLSPKKVFAEIAPILAAYDVDTLWSDQASGDAMRDIAEDVGITLVLEPCTQASKLATFKNLQTWVRTDQVELAPVENLKADLLGVRRKYTRNGITIDLLAEGARHCDYAMACALVMSKLYTPPVVAAPPIEVGSPEWVEQQRDRRRQRLVDRLEREERSPWMALGAPVDRGRSAHWKR